MEWFAESGLPSDKQAESLDRGWIKDCLTPPFAEDKKSTSSETITRVMRISDSGSSWEQDKLPLPDSIKQFDTISAPSTAVNLNGILHVAIAASDSQGANNARTNSLRGGLFVLSSKSGDNWDRIIHVFNNNDNATAESPSIACDTTEMIGANKNPYRNRLYAAWIVKSTANAGSQFSEVLFAESVDGGNTFVVPVHGGWQFNPVRLNTGRETVSNPGVEVDQSGRVTVSWTETDPDDGTLTIASRTSTNGGEGFSAVIKSSNNLRQRDSLNAPGEP